MKTLLKSIDAHLGHPGTRFLESLQYRRRMKVFNKDRLQRQRRYKDKLIHVGKYEAAIAELRQNGFVRIPGATQTLLLNRLEAEVEGHLNVGSCLQPVSKDSERYVGDRLPSVVYFSPNELTKGQEYLRKHTNHISIAEPFMHCPSSVPLAFGEMLFDIAHTYFECVPAIGSANLRKSFANSLGEFDTLYFHVDPNSFRFLKFFYYLNDVDDGGGPFCIVRGSHREKFPGWQAQYRWSEEEIASRYGKERIVNITGSVGDLIVADTTAFHRGTKVVSRDRTMLTVDYVIHPEFDGKQKPFKLPRDHYFTLNEKQKPLADFLNICARD